MCVCARVVKKNKRNRSGERIGHDWGLSRWISFGSIGPHQNTGRSDQVDTRKALWFNNNEKLKKNPSVCTYGQAEKHQTLSEGFVFRCEFSLCTHTQSTLLFHLVLRQEKLLFYFFFFILKFSSSKMNTRLGTHGEKADTRPQTHKVERERAQARHHFLNSLTWEGLFIFYVCVCDLLGERTRWFL